MGEFLDYNPITDPLEYYPIIEPTNLLQPQQYELAFPEKQRAWLRERDNQRCQYPMVNEDGEFVSYAYDVPTQVNVHHITPVYYYKSFRPEEYKSDAHNNPLNAITLDVGLHTEIHRDWIRPYQHEYNLLTAKEKSRLSLEAYVTKQTACGRPAWISTNDLYFKLIAALNSYDYMTETTSFPFDKRWEGIIAKAYEKAYTQYPKFVESYYQNRGW